MAKIKPPAHPTIGDVARRAGVSIATVSRVINRSEAVDAATRARVQAAMRDLRYTPRTAARTLATSRTGTIGLLLSHLDNEFFVPLLTGIEEAVREAGYNLLIATTGGENEADQPVPSLGAHNTDGLLVFAHSLSAAGLAACCESGFPVVLIHQVPPAGLRIPSVTVENRGAACHMVSHFVQAHGRRRIVFVKGPEGSQDLLEREQGYSEALEQHALPFDPELVIPGEFDRHVAFTSMRRLLSAGAPFDAVFASTDESAIGVLAALAEAGRTVPVEVSVGGFDDLRMSAYLSPPLTTVRAPTRQVAREAVRQLRRLIRGQTPRMRTVLPTELVLRRSCGCEN